MEQRPAQNAAWAIDDPISSIRLPLENLEYTLEQYLMDNGCRLDVETRILLAGVRDCVARVAVSTRRLENAGTQHPNSPAVAVGAA
ncbi:MAG: hypothetical protein AAFR79_02045 [Pseudomonadota bacterium]